MLLYHYMKEPKSFKSLESAPILEKETQSPVMPKESDRIVSSVELMARARLKESGAEKERAKFFNVWFVNPIIQLKNAGEPVDEDKDAFDNEKKREQALARMVYDHNREKGKHGDPDTRSYMFQYLKSPGDLIHNLEMAYDWRGAFRAGDLALSNLPELIVVFGKGGEGDFRNSQQDWVVPRVRKHASEFIERYYWESQKRMESFIGEEIVLPFNNSFRWTREEINPDTVLEAGVGYWEDFLEEYEELSRAAVQYLKSGDAKVLDGAFSDEYLKKLFDRISEYDEKDVDYVCDDFLYRDKDKNNKLGLLADFKDEEDYIEYREKISAMASNLDFEKAKLEMKKYYVETLRKYLDEYKVEYERDEDFTEWETNLLQPIIVSVSDDFAFNEFNLEHGANIAIADFKPEDIEKLIQLVSKIKSSPASLSGRRLMRAKKRFYASVEDLIEGRAHETADTEQELDILQKIFEQNKVKTILDVGCGYGRITLPLIEAGYEVDGIDTNEKFIKTIKQRIKQEKLPGGFDFEQASIMDYADRDLEKKYQSVIYTWHTILEAFGPGNLLKTLNSAWRTLEAGGVLIFDQPTRENSDMADGWYGHSPETKDDIQYLSYIMTDEEIKFILWISGFENVEIIRWTSRPTQEYPEGVKKITVSAHKPKGKGYKQYIPHLEMVS